ncbi:MAG TPA: amidohydrolase family protein [Polyangiaceae bacterium]|nr:amidohydrolase family protein [Polyangiaceae bacterium]
MARLARFTSAVALALASACGPTPGPPSPPSRGGTPAKAAAPAASAESGAAPGKRAPTEITVFHLYKFLRRVGVERDTFLPIEGGGGEAKAWFGFQDRGTQVPLAASFRLGPDGAPRLYEAWGSTSRSSDLDDRVSLEPDGAYLRQRLGLAPARARPSGPFAVASGYAPLLAQDLMLRRWVASGRPATMALLPEGSLALESRGREAYDAGGKRVTLEHVSVRGLVWGREDAWLDEAGRLAAVVTRDAEFDHFEAARDGFAELVPALAASAGADGIAWLASAAKPAERAAGEVVALVGGDLVDGTGRPPVRDAVVVVQGGTIVAAGPRASTKVPGAATSIDVSGKTVLPGLWDMHAHVQQVEQGAAYLAAGVTTVRDMGNVLEFVTGVRDAIDAGKGLGPRVLVSGIVDGEGPNSIGTTLIKTKDDIAPTLDRLRRAGCREVKLYSSFPPALVRPTAAEAHRRGLRVVGHVPSGMTAVQALDAGYDGVSHITHLFGALFTPAELQGPPSDAMRRRLLEADFSAPPMRDVIRAFAAKKAVLDDTLALYDLLNHTDEENARREPGLATLPRELRGTIGGARPEKANERAAAFDKYLALLRAMHEAGVPVVAGTDISVPGHSVHRELELYVQAGFSPMEALQAATSVPARAMRLEAEAGTVEPGKRADLVVVAGDPLADVSNVRKVSLVVARGKAYDPAELWRLAGFSP